MKNTIRVTISRRGTSLVIANMLLEHRDEHDDRDALRPTASGVASSLSDVEPHQQKARRNAERPCRPAARPARSCPTPKVASQNQLDDCRRRRSRSQIGAGRKNGLRSNASTTPSQASRNDARRTAPAAATAASTMRRAIIGRRPRHDPRRVRCPRSASRTSVIDAIERLVLAGVLVATADRGRRRSISMIRPGPRRHHDHTIRQVHRLGDRVRHEHDGRLRRRADLQQLGLHVLAGHLVEGAERLVHQQQLRVRGERPGDRDTLLHAARQLPRHVRRETRAA